MFFYRTNNHFMVCLLSYSSTFFSESKCNLAMETTVTYDIVAVGTACFPLTLQQ